MKGAGFSVQGAGCRVQGAGCRVQGAGCRVQGVRVSGFGRACGNRAHGRGSRGKPVTLNLQDCIVKKFELKNILAVKFATQHVLY